MDRPRDATRANVRELGSLRGSLFRRMHLVNLLTDQKELDIAAITMCAASLGIIVASVRPLPFYYSTKPEFSLQGLISASLCDLERASSTFFSSYRLYAGLSFAVSCLLTPVFYPKGSSPSVSRAVSPCTAPQAGH